MHPLAFDAEQAPAIDDECDVYAHESSRSRNPVEVPTGIEPLDVQFCTNHAREPEHQAPHEGAGEPPGTRADGAVVLASRERPETNERDDDNQVRQMGK